MSQRPPNSPRTDTPFPYTPLFRSHVAERGRATILPASKPDNNVTIDAARHCYHRLLRSGVEIHEYGRQRLHAKLIVIDDITYIGSANFDMRSLYLNMEVMLRVTDEAFAQEIRRRIGEDIALSVQIDPARYKGMRSEESRVGQAGVRKGISRGSQEH